MPDNYLLIYDNQRLIRLSDGQYPMYMPEVRASTTQTSFPMPIRDYILKPFGYMPVFDTALPQGDVVTEGSPEQKEDGNWYRSWNIRSFTEEEVAQNLYLAKDQLVVLSTGIVDSDKITGIVYKYKGEDKYVSTSDSEMIMLSGIKIVMENSVEEGQTYKYRFIDGTIADFTKEEMLSFILTLSTSNYNLFKNHWEFLASITTVTDISDLPVLPETFRQEV